MSDIQHDINTELVDNQIESPRANFTVKYRNKFLTPSPSLSDSSGISIYDDPDNSYSYDVDDVDEKDDEKDDEKMIDISTIYEKDENVENVEDNFSMNIIDLDTMKFDSQPEKEEVIYNNSYDEFKTCITCNLNYKTTDYGVICYNCGEEKVFDDKTYSNLTDYNTIPSSFMQFTFTGKGAKYFTKSLLKASSNASISLKMTALKEITLRNDLSKNHKVPKPAINMAVEYYFTIKNAIALSDVSFDGKSGLLSACLWMACDTLKLGILQQHIAELMEIETKMLFKGLEIIDKLASLDLVSFANKKTNTIDSFMNRYIKILNIPDKYKDFMTDLILTTEKKKINSKNDCQDSTKCAGAIMMLANRVKALGITKDKIYEGCKVSKATFNKYYKFMCENFRELGLKRVFKKHGISMDIAWKD
jgi:hypothetical protein